jgi:hypothetical protein
MNFVAILNHMQSLAYQNVTIARGIYFWNLPLQLASASPSAALELELLNKPKIRRFGQKEHMKQTTN